MRAYKVGASVQLVSRQGKKFTQRFPDLARAVAGLGAESAILDTEVAVFVGVDAMRTVSPDVRTKISATRQARYGKEAVAPTR